MNKSLSAILKGVASSYTNGKVSRTNAALLRKLLTANNTFNFANYMGRCVFLNKNVSFNFSSSQGHHHKHQHKHQHNHHHSPHPIEEMRQNLQTFSSQVQLKYPTQPQLVIKELYQQCQKFVGENKKIQILILFELLCKFIESKNLVEQYSSFFVMSAGNSYLMGKYQQVQRRCKLVLPFQIKKYGEKHNNVGDLYNMLGLSISKTSSGKGSEALEYFEKAFVIRKQLHGESSQAAEVLFNAGIIQQQLQKMFQRAEKNYLDAVQMLQNAHKPAPLLYIKTKMRLSQVQFKIHQVDSKYISDMLRLLEFIQKYKNEKKLSPYQTTNVEMFLSLLHRNLGKKFLQSNDHANAVKFLQLCLNYLRENKMETQDRIEVLQSCAIAYTNMNEFTKAAQLLQQSQKIVASSPDATDQYKFHVWKFLSQIYRKTSQPQKELNVLQKMRSLINQTKQNFLQRLDLYEADICLIYCLGNLKMFDRVIEIGKESLDALEKEETLSADSLNDFKSNVAAYVGFAYLSKGQAYTALQYFTKSDQIFTLSGSNLSRYEFHSNIMRKIAIIYIQLKKDFIHGFQYLNKHRLHILNQKQLPLPKKLNDMVVLLLDYEIQTGENNENQIVQKLIQAKYIQRINEVVHEIVKIIKQLSQNKQNKHILANYYILIDSIYQILLSFGQIGDYANKKSDLDRTRQLLTELINVYNGVFEQQTLQVAKGEYVGDEALRVSIKKASAVKQQLAK